LFTDFDGVLTDNTVLISQDGKEHVMCSRADGLAFDHLNKMGFPAYILSTESNNVVKVRANKLKIQCKQNLKNKVSEIHSIIRQIPCDPKQVIYVGNDINDLGAMSFSGLTFCPFDSHEKVKKIANVVLSTFGGKGVFREILESWFNLDLSSKYLKEVHDEY
jgi:YrbI family 3-deoxy-D-manno-octulosonate 8-phosphate phosphatase